MRKGTARRRLLAYWLGEVGSTLSWDPSRPYRGIDRAPVPPRPTDSGSDPWWTEPWEAYFEGEESGTMRSQLSVARSIADGLATEGVACGIICCIADRKDEFPRAARSGDRSEPWLANSDSMDE